MRPAARTLASAPTRRGTREEKIAQAREERMETTGERAKLRTVAELQTQNANAPLVELLGPPRFPHQHHKLHLEEGEEHELRGWAGGRRADLSGGGL